MKRFRALIIIGVVAGVMLVFVSGFWMGSGFSNGLNSSFQKAKEIFLPNKSGNTTTADGNSASSLDIKA
jgi:hypothetical protein